MKRTLSFVRRILTARRASWSGEMLPKRFSARLTAVMAAFNLAAMVETRGSGREEKSYVKTGGHPIVV